MSAFAEGVETRTQLDFLQTQGCDEAQGFVFCPPMPVRAVETWRADMVPAAALSPDLQPFTSTRAGTRFAVET
jgi:sensor c-di-GMP phosphodiesterase-like protein